MSVLSDALAIGHVRQIVLQSHATATFGSRYCISSRPLAIALGNPSQPGAAEDTVIEESRARETGIGGEEGSNVFGRTAVSVAGTNGSFWSSFRASCRRRSAGGGRGRRLCYMSSSNFFVDKWRRSTLIFLHLQ